MPSQEHSIGSRPAMGGSFAENAHDFRDWFAKHFSLDGKPYTLDLDQARAVLDGHKNTLVTARAGSGKTRVIVAKVAYLIATGQMKPAEIAVFMFNRTTALEVNQRIAKVEFDGRAITQEEIHVASTFHKFALDIMKLSGARPELISEAEHDQLIRQALQLALAGQGRRLSTRKFEELLQIIAGFIARAGQKYIGAAGIETLRAAIDEYVKQETDAEKITLHRLALAAFEHYLAALRPPKLDFNIMMGRASEILSSVASHNDASGLSATAISAIRGRVAPLRIILIDEYQDFSQLFLNLVQALRANCPAAHLFAVGDDWQAINRFAGSDVEYFTNFTKYFPEDAVNIPLVTNYRSHRRIVENANDYMLANYNPDASRAVPFSRQRGKIIRQNPLKTRFDASDLHEDALGDARFQLALAQHAKVEARHIAPAAAQLLKTVTKIFQRNRHAEIMLLHRHNFTTFPNLALVAFHAALRDVVIAEGIMSAETFATQVRCMTMHKSKGLEAEVVILLESNRELILGQHPRADLWQVFGDSFAIEKADQHRLLYVAMTRARQKLYILSTDRTSPF